MDSAPIDSLMVHPQSVTVPDEALTGEEKHTPDRTGGMARTNCESARFLL